MKIRTKFLAAVLATVMTFGCALSASAWDSKDTTPPAVEFGNSAMPGIKNGNTATATLTLKSSDFADVTGAKLTVKLPEGMTLVKANVTGNGSWVAGTDYKVVEGDAGTITLVNVFNIGDAAKNLSVYLGLTVSGTLNGAITVSGEFADTNVDKVYKYDGFATGTLTLSRSEANYDNKEDATAAIAGAANDNYFVPVGGVYTMVDGKVKYYSKPDNAATFDLSDASGNITVLKCPLPADGEDVTTFGYTIKDGDKNSEKEYEKYNGIQFGAYTNKKSGKKFGTLIIMGDYTAFKNCYSAMSASAISDDALLNLIVTRYDQRVADNKITLGEPLTLKKGDHSITVKKVKQTAHMWEDANNLQYAVRLYKLVKDRSYTGVAYSYSNGAYNFSKEIQTKVNPYAEQDF